MASLKYFTHTRHNLKFGAGFLSRYMENPSSEHLASAKHVKVYQGNIQPQSGICERGRFLCLMGVVIAIMEEMWMIKKAPWSFSSFEEEF